MAKFKNGANAQSSEFINEQATVAQVSITPAKAEDGYFIFGSHEEAYKYLKGKSESFFILEESFCPYDRYFKILKKRKDYFNLDDQKPVLLGDTGIYSAPYACIDWKRKTHLYSTHIIPYYIDDKLYFGVRGREGVTEGDMCEMYHVVSEDILIDYATKNNLPVEDKLNNAAYYLRRVERYNKSERLRVGSIDNGDWTRFLFGIDGVTISIPLWVDAYMIIGFDDSLKIAPSTKMKRDEIEAAVDSYYNIH